MSFSSEFKDNWQILERYTENGVEHFDSMQQFFKRQAEIELEYGRSLQKLIKGYKDELAKKNNEKNTEKGSMASFNKAVLSSTLAQSWQQLLNEADQNALLHVKFAEDIEVEIRKPIKNQLKENEKTMKASFDNIRKITADLSAAVSNLEKSRGNQERAIKDMNASITALDKVTKDPKSKKEAIDKQKLDHEKKSFLARECIDAYSKTIDDTNSQKNLYFNDLLPKALDFIQKDDERNRIDFIKEHLSKYSGFLQSHLEPYKNSADAMSTIFNLISPPYDSDLFVKLAKTGVEGIPEDYVFDEKVSSPTRRRVIESSGNISPTSPLTPTSILPDDDETITSLPLKKGKRKAVDRVKEINKELSFLNQKVRAIDTILGVKATREYSERSEQTLNDQKDLLVPRINRLIERKRLLQTYSGVVTNDIDEFTPTDTRSMSRTKRTSSTPTYDHVEDGQGYNNGQEPVAEEQYDQQAEYQQGNEFQLGNGCIGRAQALYDFDATPGTEEVSFKADNVVEITEKLDDGWWRIKGYLNGEDVVGLVPGNYFREDLFAF